MLLTPQPNKLAGLPLLILLLVGQQLPVTNLEIWQKPQHGLQLLELSYALWEIKLLELQLLIAMVYLELKLVAAAILLQIPMDPNLSHLLEVGMAKLRLLLTQFGLFLKTLPDISV